MVSKSISYAYRIIEKLLSEVRGTAGVDSCTRFFSSSPSVAIPFHRCLHHPYPPHPAVSPRSPPPPNPAKSLLAQSSHLILGLPLRILPATLSASALFVNRSPSSRSTHPLTDSSPASSWNSLSHQLPPSFACLLSHSRNKM